MVLGRPIVEPSHLRDDRLDGPLGDPLGEVGPVRPDIRDDPRGSAASGVDAPVVVGLQHQPVLKEASAHSVERTERTGTHACQQLDDHRMEPGVVGDGRQAA